MKRVRLLMSALAGFGLVACGSYPNAYSPTFIEMARVAAEQEYQQKWMAANARNKDLTAGQTLTLQQRLRAAPSNPYYMLKFSDQLALNYANERINTLRPKFNRARHARSISSTAMVGGAALTGTAGTFDLGYKTLGWLGLSGAVIPQLQGIFDAKGRAQNYQIAVHMIEDAINQFLALNQNPSATQITQNGVTLVHVTDAAIHVVEKAMEGLVPTVHEMAKATEKMTIDGAKKTLPGTRAFNHISEDGLVLPTRTAAAGESRENLDRLEGQRQTTKKPEVQALDNSLSDIGVVLASKDFNPATAFDSLKDAQIAVDGERASASKDLVSAAILNSLKGSVTGVSFEDDPQTLDDFSASHKDTRLTDTERQTLAAQADKIAKALKK